MAPEQATEQEVDGRADLYAFGVVLYEALTGRVPFRGGTPLQVAAQHVNAPLPPARALNPDLAGGVEAVLTRALAKSPAHRYGSGAELIAALAETVEVTETRREASRPAEAVGATVLEAPPSTAGTTPPPPAPLPDQVRAAASQAGAGRHRSSQRTGETPRHATEPARPRARLLPVVSGVLGATAAFVLAIALFLAPALAPRIESVWLDPKEPLPGKPVTVHWSVKNARTVTIQGVAGALDPRTGAHTLLHGLSDGTTLMVSASNLFGTASSTLRVTAPSPTSTPTPTPTPTPTVRPEPVVEEFVADPPAVAAGQSVTLRWRVTHADGASLDPLGPVAVEGEVVHTPENTTTYILQASQGEKRAQATVEVRVVPPTATAVPPTATAVPPTWGPAEREIEQAVRQSNVVLAAALNSLTVETLERAFTGEVLAVYRTEIELTRQRNQVRSLTLVGLRVTEIQFLEADKATAVAEETWIDRLTDASGAVLYFMDPYQVTATYELVRIGPRWLVADMQLNQR
jgi:hypothetical protein